MIDLRPDPAATAEGAADATPPVPPVAGEGPVARPAPVLALLGAADAPACVDDACLPEEPRA